MMISSKKQIKEDYKLTSGCL